MALKHGTDLINRLAVAFIFIYFGFLKIVGLSPADELVTRLARVTLGWVINPDHFFILFGCFEVLIGIIFLIRRLTPYTCLLFTAHMIATFLPFIFLPELTWSQVGVPTLTGQYIIKNLALIALVYTIYSEFMISRHAKSVS